jgi:hypothetical protein
LEYNQIETDFVVRTFELIEGYSGSYEATLLINCCLGLLVLPREKHQSSIPDTEIPLTGTLWGLSRDSITIDCSSCGYILSDVVRKIRNGICHFKVKTLPDGSGEINTLEIKDRGGFSAELSLEELKELTRSLAKHVIQG